MHVSRVIMCVRARVRVYPAKMFECAIRLLPLLLLLLIFVVGIDLPAPLLQHRAPPGRGIADLGKDR